MSEAEAGPGAPSDPHVALPIEPVEQNGHGLQQAYRAGRVLRYGIAACGVVAAALGLMGLIGWLSGSLLLVSFGPEYIPMAPATGLSLLWAGLALLPFAIGMRPGGLTRVAAGLVIIISTSRLVEMACGVEWGASRLFLPAWVFGHAVALAPIDMALPTALALLGSGISLFLLLTRTARTIAYILASAVLVVGSAFLLGYVYGKPLLYGHGMIPVALPTALGLAMMGLGTVMVIVAWELAVLRQGAMSQAEDQAERRVAAEVHRERVLLQAIVDQMPVGVTVGEAPSGKIILGNKQIEATWGGPFVPPASIGDYEAWVGHHPDGRRYEPQEWPLARSLANGEAVQHEVIAITRLDGKPAILDVSSAPIYDAPGNIIAAVGIFVDITEREQLQDELRAYREHLETLVAERTAELEVNQRRLRALAADLTVAEQHERQRLAGAVHDEVTQTLSAIKLHLQALQVDPGAQPVAQELRDATALVAEAIGQARAIMAELSPPGLQENGLSETLRWWGAQVQAKHGLDVTVEVEELPQRLAPDVEVILFQTVKELLQNTIKYAQAKQATINLHCGEDRLALEVADNGDGFDPATTEYKEGGGFGLFSIRERMAYLGGSFQIESAPGAGTRSIISLPFSCQIGRPS